VRRIAFAGVLLIGCGKAVKPPASLAESAATVLDKARARPVAGPARVRFNIHLDSPNLHVNGSTGGGLIIAAPAGRMDLFGPLGNAVATFATDGERVDIVSGRDHSWLYAEDAQQALLDLTGGAAGIGDVLGVLVGDLPFDDARARSLKMTDDGKVRVSLQGPDKTAVDALIDPSTDTPIRVEAHDADGALVLAADYDGFTPVDESGVLAPEAVTLHLPLLDLTLDLKFRAWKPIAPDDVDPKVFHPAVPDAFAKAPLEDALHRAIDEVSPPDARP